MNNRSAIIIPTLAFAKYLKTIGYNRRPIPSGDPIGGNERAAAVCGSRKLAAHIQITDVGPNCVVPWLGMYSAAIAQFVAGFMVILNAIDFIRLTRPSYKVNPVSGYG
ncbi:MAG TPA: hypothetical protein VFA77_05720 [Candidatus Eisenbacteria bacterium]|nr:hypothetical protein [Candidatus Eisenbacteria bacterium]